MMAAPCPADEYRSMTRTQTLRLLASERRHSRCRRRRALCGGDARGLDGSGEDVADGPGQGPGRAVPIPVRRPAHELRAAAGKRRRLDAQGDKIMARLVYRKIGNRE